MQKTKKITLTALMTSLVFIATGILPVIPIPLSQGYIHLGDSMIFIACAITGFVPGIIAAAIGSALADFYLGYAIWILPTLIVKGLMAFVTGYFMDDNKSIYIKRIIIIFTLTVFSVFFILSIIINIGINPIANDVSSFLSDQMSKVIEEGKTIDEYILLMRFLSAISAFMILIISGLYIFLKKKGKDSFSNYEFFGMAAGGLTMTLGYYFTAAILYGNFLSPVFAIPFNIIQFSTGIVVAGTVIYLLKKAGLKKVFVK